MLASPQNIPSKGILLYTIPQEAEGGEPVPLRPLES